MTQSSSAPRPSGTVVVVRDADALEVLLLQRMPRGDQPGPWVFPGGTVEASDRRPGGPPDAQARRAAVREAAEEASLALSPDVLIPISRWITPAISPKRFDTWFFLGRAGQGASVRVDGQEIGDHRWLRPRDALDAHQQGTLQLAPPTFVTIAWLTEFESSADALHTWTARPIPLFEPRVLRQPDGACMLYAGDAGYAEGDLEAPGARHRLWTAPGAWRYELRFA